MQLEELSKKHGIGLTGGIACGKSTIAKILENLGYPVIDADQLARKAVESGTKGLAKIVERFGGSVLQEDGSLNRKLVAEIVFSDPAKRKQLEGIVHPIIHDLLGGELRRRGLFEFPRYWFYEASLLIENGTARNFREVWLVHCLPNIQVARLKKRDNRDERILSAIIKSQLPFKQKAALAEVLIDTSSPLEELEAKVRVALERLTRPVEA
jgi:dephospho-CoA kinase